MSEPVRAVLATIEERSRTVDPEVKAKVRAAQAAQDYVLPIAERDRLYAGTPLFVAPEVGQLLYALTRARRPRLAFEFGASTGYSTLHLAAALADTGAGHLVTTEKDPGKAHLTRANLDAAGLAGWATVHTQDALTTIAALAEPVELVFLDGWNDLYLDVLRALEPRLARQALVVADYSADDPMLAPFVEHLFADGGSYAATYLPISDGVAVATWDGA